MQKERNSNRIQLKRLENTFEDLVEDAKLHQVIDSGLGSKPDQLVDVLTALLKQSYQEIEAAGLQEVETYEELASEIKKKVRELEQMEE